MTAAVTFDETASDRGIECAAARQARLRALAIERRVLSGWLESAQTARDEAADAAVVAMAELENANEWVAKIAEHLAANLVATERLNPRAVQRALVDFEALEQ